MRPTTSPAFTTSANRRGSSADEVAVEGAVVPPGRTSSLLGSSDGFAGRRAGGGAAKQTRAAAGPSLRAPRPAAKEMPASPGQRTQWQEVRRLSKDVAGQMGPIARHGGTSFASVGAAVLFGACTLAQPFAHHAPLVAGLTMAAGGAVFVLSLIVGLMLEACCKRRALRSLSAETVHDIDRVYRRLVARQRDLGGVACWEDEMALKEVRELVGELLGGGWHSLRVLAHYAARVELQCPSSAPGSLTSAWKRLQPKIAQGPGTHKFRPKARAS